ncbi:hypothetical protein ACFX2B_040231 [Malus domestica]
MEDSDAGSLRTVGPITDVAAHGTRTPEMESFSTRNKMRVGNGLQQNPNQTSIMVIEDVDEGINSQTMVNTLSGNQELRSLATIGFDGGSRGYEVTANLSSQNFQPINMLVINTKRLQSQEMSQQRVKRSNWEQGKQLYEESNLQEVSVTQLDMEVYLDGRGNDETREMKGDLNLWWDNGMERRRQIKIVKIKDGNGQWVENASQIRKTIGEHYKSLFASEGPRDWGKLLDFVEQKVTTKMNLTLICLISDSELRMQCFKWGEFNVALLAKQCWRMVMEQNPYRRELRRQDTFRIHHLWKLKKEVELHGLGQAYWKGERFYWAVLNGSLLLKNGIFNPIERELNEIKEIQIRDPSCNDRLIWPLEKMGVYMVKLGYHWTHDKESNRNQSSSLMASISCQVWKCIWKLETPLKILTFMWRVLHRALATRLAFFKIRVVASPLCLICNEQEETMEHMFFLYPWVEPVWFGGQLNYKVNTNEIDTFSNWLHFLIVNNMGNKQDKT